MKIVLLIASLSLTSLTSLSFGAGFARSSNFVVGAEQQELADAVLAKAEAYRKRLAQEWLGADLSLADQRVVIYVYLSDEDDYGLTRIDPGDARGKHHMMWIVTLPNLVDTTLAHEMTHVVFGCGFQDRIPIWANEGAASLLDDARRQTKRQRVIAEFARTGQWPDLNEILDCSTFASSDARRYATSASVTEFLLSHSTKPTFLSFAAAGQSQGWDAALWRYYRMRNVRELQRQWQDWTKRGVTEPLSRASASQQTAGRSRQPVAADSYWEDL